MEKSKLLEIIKDEKKFPYENMSLEERNYYLNIIRNCKDVCDTDNKVDNISKCEIIKLNLKKDGNVVRVDGYLKIGSDKISENRLIVADIYLEENSIIVDMHIDRLCFKGDHKSYTVFEKFILEKEMLKRISKYNYNVEPVSNNIENEEMKGKLR